jgi:hypothetical protein
MGASPEEGSGPRPSRPFDDPLAGDGDGAAPRPFRGRGRNKVEDPSTTFCSARNGGAFRAAWGKKPRAGGVALRLRLWPDRRYKGRDRGCPRGTMKKRRSLALAKAEVVRRRLETGVRASPNLSRADPLARQIPLPEMPVFLRRRLLCLHRFWPRSNAPARASVRMLPVSCE